MIRIQVDSVLEECVDDVETDGCGCDVGKGWAEGRNGEEEGVATGC